MRTVVMSALVASAVVLGACQTTVRQHGYQPEEESVRQVQVGQTNRDQVQQLLGTPTSVAAFDENTWLYISRRTSQTAFMEPRLLEQSVIAITFNPTSGRVTNVRRLTGQDALAIQPVDRETPSPGREMTVMEQLIGNVGRFNTQRPGR